LEGVKDMVTMYADMLWQTIVTPRLFSLLELRRTRIRGYQRVSLKQRNPRQADIPQNKLGCMHKACDPYCCQLQILIREDHSNLDRAGLPVTHAMVKLVG
jgi:hypothetical protein